MVEEENEMEGIISTIREEYEKKIEEIEENHKKELEEQEKKLNEQHNRQIRALISGRKEETPQPTKFEEERDFFETMLDETLKQFI